MFYLKYLWAELFRRRGKTITISLGLALSSAIIITIISISQGLSSAQDKVLNPLQNVGTDILVTRTVNTENMKDLDQATREEFMSQNRISTDLSKLGNPGDNFSTDSFQSGTLLTFASSESERLDKSLVANSANGLFLNVFHREGKIPQVTAEIKTGGEIFQIERQMTDKQRQQMREAMDKAREEVQAKGFDLRSEEGREALDEALKKYAPNLSTEFITPERIYRQDIGPISTDIQTENFTVAGVDTSKTDIGLILSNQITEGTYFNGENQAILNLSYSQKKNIKVNDKIKLSGTEYNVVGLVEPKLYTNSADIYLRLNDLQKLSQKEGKINIIMVKSSNVKSVEETSKKLSGLFTGAKITNAADTAKQVSGSLINASNLVNKFIGLASILVVVTAFIIVSLLTILSVNKRVREIGTLKALGWSNGLVTRQIVMENLVLGIFGAFLGIGLGVLIIYILNHYDITFSANFANSDNGADQRFMRRFISLASNHSSVNIKLSVEYSYIIMLLGALTALLGSFVAGIVAAMKSARMKPQEALRKLE